VSDEHAIDQLLAAWEERLRRVDENLIALEGDPTYQMLSGTSGTRAALEGVTAARVSPALDALAELFEHRGRLTEVLERAREVRQSVGFFDKQQKLAEVELLLSGPSIKLGTKPTPLARRSLLDSAASDVAVMPEQLLAAMAQAYEAARDAVMQVSRAWATLEPVMEQLERDLQALRTLATQMREMPTVGAELSAIERDLAAYRVLVAQDPLGVEGGLAASMGPRMEGVRRRLEGLVAERQRVTAALAAADAALRELAQVHAAALAVPARASAEFTAEGLPPCVAEDLIVGLQEWRAKLGTTAGAGRWHAADVGLARWQETARSYIAADTAAAHAYDALAAKRVELEGRLSARRAQLQAFVARGAAVDPKLEGRGRDAAALLKQRPMNLASATAAVDAFDAEVVAVARAGRGR
jgi:chaperonin cofactor prefoldin